MSVNLSSVWLILSLPYIFLLSSSPPSLVPIMSRADDLPDVDLSRRTLDATRIHFELASQTSTTQQITVNETETQVIQEYKEKQNVPVTQDEASETIYVSYFILYQSHLDSKNLSLGWFWTQWSPESYLLPQAQKVGNYPPCLFFNTCCMSVPINFPVSPTKLMLSLNSFDGLRIQPWFPFHDARSQCVRIPGYSRFEYVRAGLWHRTSRHGIIQWRVRTSTIILLVGYRLSNNVYYGWAVSKLELVSIKS